MFSLRPDISGIKRKFPVSALGMALCCGMAIGGAHADSTCGVLSATYLLTVLNSDGSFAARQLITLTEDRNVIVDDSAEGGVPGVFNPFTTAQGTWECESRSSPIQADATALFFSLPGSVSGGQTIGRIDYEITLHAVSKSISGTIDLRFFPLTGNPLATPVPAPNASFTFTGVRVTN
jgi:hypothetical protein